MNKISTFLVFCLCVLFSVSTVLAQTVTYKVGDSTTFEEELGAIGTGELASASEIYLSGDWTGANFLTLKNALKTAGAGASENTALQKADLSGVTAFTGNFNGDVPISEGFQYLFASCMALTEVSFPAVGVSIPSAVSFQDTFSGCTNLITIANFDIFTTVSSFNRTFYNCSALVSVDVPSSTGYDNKVSFHQTFSGCANLSVEIDISGFGYISTFHDTFLSCNKLAKIVLPSGTDDESISFYRTFSACANLQSDIDLSGFSNISSLQETFNGCNALKNIKLPGNNSFAGNISCYMTFQNCTSLQSLDLSGFSKISNMQSAFTDCKAITSIKLPTINVSEATDISFFTTFKGCTNLQSLDLSGFSNVMDMQNTFRECAALSSVQLPSSLSTVTAGVNLYKSFAGCRALLEVDMANLYNISNMQEAFNNCSQLTKLTMPAKNSANNSVRFDGAFSACTQLQSVDLSGFTTISTMQNAFNGCGSLTAVTMPTENSDSNSVRFDGSFSGCTQLQNIDLSGFTIISTMQNAFNGCASLTAVTMPTENSDSNNVSFEAAFLDCVKLQNIDLSAFGSISSMYQAFQRCGALESVILPSANVNDVSFGFAFSGCEELKTIDLGGFANHITDLQFAFTECKKLASVTLPANNKDVSVNFSFGGCAVLKEVDLSGFTNITNLKESFFNSPALEKIVLGTDPNSLSADKLSSCFYGISSSCLKWLPDGVYTIPQTWIDNLASGDVSYSNFVMGIDLIITGPYSFSIGGSFNAITPTIPAYAAHGDGIWQLAPDENFVEEQIVVPNSETVMSLDYDGWYLRYKLETPKAYVYSNAKQIAVSSDVIAYIGDEPSYFSLSQLVASTETSSGNLASYDIIELHNTWSVDDLITFKKAIKSSWISNNKSINETLKKVDMSNVARLTGEFATPNTADGNAFPYMFSACTALEEVTLPTVIPTSGVTFQHAFDSCISLTTVKNFDKYTRLSSLEMTFYKCGELRNITLPASDSHNDAIGVTLNGMFAYCTSLAIDIDLSKFGCVSSLQATFRNCSSLVNITLPTTTAYQGSVSFFLAFENCVNLTSDIDLSTFTNISNMQSAFSNCTELKNIKMPTENRYSGSVSFFFAFNNCQELISDIDISAFTSIQHFQNAFNNCSKLTQVKMPAENLYSGSVSFFSAFSGCLNLESDFDLSMFTNIEHFQNAFSNCEKVTTIKMPSENSYQSSVSFFQAFLNCKKLQSDIDLSAFNNISNLQNAFTSCEELTTIKLPSTNNYTGGIPFYLCFDDCKKLQSEIDLSGFLSISDMQYTFRNCSALTTVTLPSTRTISTDISFQQTFYNCLNLTPIIDLSGFGDNITSLFGTFANCKKVNNIILPNNVNDKSISFQYAFAGCEVLEYISNLDKFTNINDFLTTFRYCPNLKEIRLGSDPSIAEYINNTTFDDTNSEYLKWLPEDVDDIPQTWKDAFNTDITKPYFGNFVLPLTVDAVSAPSKLSVGTTHTFTLPAITQPYAARVGSPIWRLIYNPNSDSPVTTLIEATTPTEDITFDKVGYYTLSCGAKSPNGTTYWSVETPITVVDVTYGSYSLTVTAPSTSTVEIKDSEGVSTVLTYSINNESEGVTKFQFTQGVPSTTYTVFQDGIQIETATMSQVPIYTAASGSHSTAPSDNIVVELKTNLTLTEATSFNNLLTKVSCGKTYKNTYSSVVNLAPIAVEDGLLVEVDLKDCENQWAYMTMPFDFDVTTGIRYLKDGVETVAVPETDVYISLYDPAKRAVNGEGTKNWTYVKSGVIKAGQGFLFAKETADVYKILALNPNSLDAKDKKIELQFNKADEEQGRTGWDTNWNFIGSPFTYEYFYRPTDNEPKFLYRRNDGNWAGGYELNYDAILGGETLYPYTPYLTQVWGDEFWTLKVDNSTPFKLSSRAVIERHAFGLYLSKDDIQIDKVGWIFTPNSSRDVLYNEDAIKASLGKNCMWTPFEGRNLIYNDLPFEGERMTFDLNIYADANSTAYKINMLSSTTEGHDIYIRETNSNTWHNLSVSDYILPASTSSATRTFEVSIARNRIVTSTPLQESNSVIVYSNNGVIFVEGVSHKDVVSVITTSGVKVFEYSNNTQHTISNLALGSYLIRIETEKGVVTKKITNVPK